MALPKKKSLKKSSTAMVKKKPAKATKKVVKKMPEKKKAVSKKISAPKAFKKLEKKSPSIAPESKKVVVVRRRWFSFFRTSAMILVLAAGAAAVSLNPSAVDHFKASILAQIDSMSGETISEPEENKGILISYQTNGTNEQKLLDIFRTVFPETGVTEVHYQSEEGKQLVDQLGVSEIPNIYFKKEAFESEKLSEVVKDLFTLQGDYYGLNVSLVNPSHQVKIKGSLSTEGGIWLGQEEAPITVYVYSDVKCQHCRVSERNNTAEWKKLMDEGMVRTVYLDLPQDSESMFYSTALSCYYDQKKDAEGYLDLRERIFSRPNVTKAYTVRELRRMGLEYEKDCDEPAYRTLFRNRMKTADQEGVTGVPALYLSESEGTQYVRFTGAKDFAEYQSTLDGLLGQSASEPANQ